MKEKFNDPAFRDVTLKQLHALAAIAKEGKITSAANALGLTPPAVTLQLKALERSLGLTLFERSRHGLRPTDAGRYLIAMHARLTSLLDEANEAVIEMKGMGRGRLRIGAVSAAQYFVPKLVAAFKRSHPRIKIELHIANRAETLADLAELKFDMAVMGRPPDPAQFEQQIIGEHPHVIIASSRDRHAARNRIRLETLDEETFIVREPGSGTRLLMERTFMMSRFSPRATMEFKNTETIKQAVMAGLGLAFVSAHTVAAEVESGALAILRMQGFPVTRHWYAVRPCERQLTPVGQVAWKFVIEKGASYLPVI